MSIWDTNYIIPFAVRRYHGNILNVYFKFPLVKKRWNIFITCHQKMVHLSSTRVSTKKYILKHSMQEYIYIYIYIYIYGITATLFPFAVRRCQCHENIFNVCFKFLLVKKRLNILVSYQQKMAYLSGTRVST